MHWRRMGRPGGITSVRHRIARGYSRGKEDTEDWTKVCDMYQISFYIARYYCTRLSQFDDGIMLQKQRNVRTARRRQQPEKPSTACLPSAPKTIYIYDVHGR